tara:strand:+ start:1207 stop:2355 length:1149 start_codon:yes stop_codon:yes gene_type:complete
MKKPYLVIISFLTTIVVIYAILFIYTFLNFNNEFNYAFKSLKNLNFHEKYSKKIHHIRDENILNALFKKSKVEDLLFTTMNELGDKEIIVLFQGDSWMAQLNYAELDNFASVKLVQNFGRKKKVGFVNGGIGSYSPSLMNVQLDVLEHDFEIFPDVVVAYIDQTDIGDENCRYKNNKIYENGILKLVQPESHLMYRDLFNYTQIYGLSRILLDDNSKILKTFKLINFKFKYGLTKSVLRFYRKYISQSQEDKEKITKCYVPEIQKYLINPSDKEIKYFSDSINEYIKKIEQKKHIKKLFLVTAPHKNNFKQNYYKINVSDIVDDVVKNKKNITHINISKILLNDKNFNHEGIWLADEMHFNYDFYGKLFIKKILDELSKYLN